MFILKYFNIIIKTFPTSYMCLSASQQCLETHKLPHIRKEVDGSGADGWRTYMYSTYEVLHLLRNHISSRVSDLGKAVFLS